MSIMCCIDITLVIQIVLCSVIGGLAMNCGNNGILLSDWINCSSLCDICRSLSAPTSNDCKVDAFLNSFCASVTPTILACTQPTIVLGSLLGVFVIVLTAVIIGWVWTCWTFKRKGKMDISSKHTTVVTNTKEEERYFKNPIHEDTSSEENSTSSSVNNEAPQNPNSSATIYNTIDKNEAGGPAYDVLSREKSTVTKKTT